MCFAATRKKAGQSATFFISDDCHPQTIEVVRTRATALGIKLIVGKPDTLDFKASEVLSSLQQFACRLHVLPLTQRKQVVGAIVQYPNTEGCIVDYGDFVRRAHDSGAFVACGTDLLALTLLKPPGTHMG